MLVRAKSINVFMYNGTLGGVVCVEEPSWVSGEMYLAPRGAALDLLETGACDKRGVYLLLSGERVLIGRSSHLYQLISQETPQSDEWDRLVVLTTSDDRLEADDIEYLVNAFVEKAQAKSGVSALADQPTRSPKLGQFREAFLGQYLEGAYFILRFVGITTFVQGSAHESQPNTHASSIRPAPGERLSKTTAINYLKENGVDVGRSNDCTFATLASGGDYFWANPRTLFLDKDWHIILNNYSTFELVVLFIPSNTLHLRGDALDGLICRKDKPELIDLRITADSLFDMASNMDFSRFAIARVPY